MIRMARDLWRVVEPYYQLTSRAPEVEAACAGIGVVRADHRYFGSRLAPVGPVSIKMAVALLYGFAPEYVGRAVPDLWSTASPGAMTVARLDAVAAIGRRVLGDEARGAPMAAAADLARELVEAIDFAGRPLAAAHAGVPWSDEPAVALWQACAVLREHRGDGHWAATSAEDLDGVECHVLHAADGAMPADLLQRVSGWDDDAWTAGVERLLGRGLVTRGDHGLAITDSGRAAKLRLEWATDRSALQPLEAVGLVRAERLRQAMRPWVDRVMAADVVGAWTVREERWRDLPDPP